MAVLAAAVTIAIVLTVLNLVLTMGVIARLRRPTTAEPLELTVMMAAGEPPAEFASQTLDAQPVDNSTLAGGALVAFLSPDCRTCQQQLPEYLAYAENVPGGRDRVLAVVVGAGDDAVELAERLRPVARVVVEERGGPLTKAFKVSGYPAYGLVDAFGVLRFADYRIDQLPPVPAATA